MTGRVLTSYEYNLLKKTKEPTPEQQKELIENIRRLEKNLLREMKDNDLREGKSIQYAQEFYVPRWTIPL